MPETRPLGKPATGMTCYGRGVRGPIYLMLGIFLYGVLDANSKLLSGRYSAMDALFFRYAVLVALILGVRAIMPGAGGPLATRHPWLHLLRSISAFGSGILFFHTFRLLPMAHGYMIFFTAPFMILAITRLWLKEAVPVSAWAWCGVAFGGVMLAVGPQLAGGASLLGVAAALGGTLTYAIVVTINRRLRTEGGFARLILWPAVLGLVVATPVVALELSMPPAADLLALSVNGVLAGAATVALAAAFRHATPARLAPFEFIVLPLSIGFDWFVFAKPPEAMLVLGGVVVVVACVMSERAVRR